MGGGGKVVLLVDDDVLVRMTAADLLEEAGFRVVEAGSADEALERLEADGASIQVLLTDVHMPGTMDGLELARDVDRRWPHIRLIVSSGLARYSDRDIPDHGSFVSKPWTLPRLVSAIDKARRS